MLLGSIAGPDLVIVIVVIAALIFGGSAIPKLARNLGSAKNEFEKGLKSSKASHEALPESDENSGSGFPR